MYRHGASVELSKDLYDNVDCSAAVVARILREGRPVYGVNTGFGKLSSVQIDDTDLEQLQRNLVLSHTVGVGDPIPESIVRLIMAMKIASFGHGASGVRRELVETLQDMLLRGVLPVIPAQGSVGASGDLAPLAHLAACVIGCGHAWFEGEQLPGVEALQRADIKPLTLGPKEAWHS